MFSEVAEIALVATRLGQFQQLLKTRVILILNFTRPHAITYTYCCIHSLSINLRLIPIITRAPRPPLPQATGLAITRPCGAKVIPCTSCGVLAWATLFYLDYGPHTEDFLVILDVCGRGIAAYGTPSALCWSPVREVTFVL